MESFSVCLFVIGLFDFALCPQGSSMSEAGDKLGNNMQMIKKFKKKKVRPCHGVCQNFFPFKAE